MNQGFVVSADEYPIIQPARRSLGGPGRTEKCYKNETL